MTTNDHDLRRLDAALGRTVAALADARRRCDDDAIARLQGERDAIIARVFVHLDERTTPRDETAICPCGWAMDLHGPDGECPPAEGLSGIEVAQRMQRVTPWSLAMADAAWDAGVDPCK